VLGDGPGASARVERAAHTLILGLLVILIAFTASAPAWALPTSDQPPTTPPHCSHH
jgi:hypothetical protein